MKKSQLLKLLEPFVEDADIYICVKDESGTELAFDISEVMNCGDFVTLVKEDVSTVII